MRGASSWKRKIFFFFFEGWRGRGEGGGDGASLERNVFSFSSSCVSQLLLNGM